MGWAEDIWNSAKQKVSNVTEKIGNAIDDGISFVKDNASAVVHTALDVAGFIPVVGTAADVANAAIYAAEGDWKNAGLSALSAIPGIGDGIAAVSKSTKVVKAAKTVSKIGKAANEAVGVLGSLKNAAEGDFTGVITDLLFAGKGKIKSKLLDKFRSSRLGKKLLPYLDKANDWLQKAKGKIKTGANKVKEKVKQLGKKVGSLKDKLKQKVADLKERLKNFGKKIKCKLLKNGKCFTGDTLVYTKEGYLPIKNIRAGDDIYSREERTGETGFQKVEEVFLRSVHTIYTIEVNTTAKIQTTSGHPFYVEGEGWVIANQLQVGMNLQTINGTAVITDLRKERTEEEIPVYNFRVSEWSSYFVSEWNVYVHNGKGYKGNNISNLDAGMNDTKKIKAKDSTGTDIIKETVSSEDELLDLVDKILGEPLENLKEMEGNYYIKYNSDKTIQYKIEINFEGHDPYEGPHIRIMIPKEPLNPKTGFKTYRKIFIENWLEYKKSPEWYK